MDDRMQERRPSLQQAPSQVPYDKKRIALIAQSCAAAAEAAGVLLSHRVVAADTKRDRIYSTRPIVRSVKSDRLNQACR
jgi:hypothetical protein